MVAQDASGAQGQGGWVLARGALYTVAEGWPAWVRDALAAGRWSISPAELLIELQMLTLVRAGVQPPPHIYITDFTDNEAARSAANKGTSGSAHMAPIAAAIGRLADADGVSLRTFRITTKQNDTADRLSRELTHVAGAELAYALGVAHFPVELPDPTLWDLVPGHPSPG